MRITAWLFGVLLSILGSIAGAETLSYTTYYHNDHLGSPVAATNEQGALLWRAHFRPYGERQEDPKEIAFGSVGYTGHIQDADSGMVYAGARYYDPLIGRFMAIDPAAVQSSAAATFNRYNYAANNPYRYNDPSGQIPIDTLWDFANVAYDLGKATVGAATGNSAMVAEGMSDAALDAGAMLVPYMPAGGSKLARAGLGEASEKIGAGKLPGPTVDKATGEEVGRFVVDSKGNTMIEPVGGSTVKAGKGGVDTHTLYPNGSNYQRLNPQGHGNNPTPHGHGHLQGSGPGMKGQGKSIDPSGNEVPWNSSDAHWPIK